MADGTISGPVERKGWWCNTHACAVAKHSHCPGAMREIRRSGDALKCENGGVVLVELRDVWTPKIVEAEKRIARLHASISTLEDDRRRTAELALDGLNDAVARWESERDTKLGSVTV